jgi:hypothetical protein
MINKVLVNDLNQFDHLVMVMKQVDFELNLKFLIYVNFLINNLVDVQVDYNEVKEFQYYNSIFFPEDIINYYDLIEHIEDVYLM